VRLRWQCDAAHEQVVREQEEVIAEQDTEEAAEGM
jgi:hypothetical protein